MLPLTCPSLGTVAQVADGQGDTGRPILARLHEAFVDGEGSGGDAAVYVTLIFHQTITGCNHMSHKTDEVKKILLLTMMFVCVRFVCLFASL